uniref:Neur_chan_memb domain-containing protein n=1 Tax=Heterorhabditis bacteriophora TaxID=37862 RepID=A0A1I7X0P3_HETBA
MPSSSRLATVHSGPSNGGTLVAPSQTLNVRTNSEVVIYYDWLLFSILLSVYIGTLW